MNETTELAARVQELESRLVFQDDTIDRLNKVLLEQWNAIDRLSRRVQMLEQQLGDIEGRLPPEDEAPPPHY